MSASNRADERLNGSRHAERRAPSLDKAEISDDNLPHFKEGKGKTRLRLKSQMKMPPPTLLLTNLVKKPSNSLLLPKRDAIEMFANGQSKLTLGDSSLGADDSIVEFIIVRLLLMLLLMSRFVDCGDWGGILLLMVVVVLQIGSSSGDGGWTPETDPLGEEDARVLIGIDAGSGEIVGISVGVKDFVGHF